MIPRPSVDRRVLVLALAGDLADDRNSGTELSVLTVSFGLGTALGPLSAGYLVRFGFVVPFVFGAGLALIGLVLVYTQVEETLDDPHDARREAPDRRPTTPPSVDD